MEGRMELEKEARKANHSLQRNPSRNMRMKPT